MVKVTFVVFAITTRNLFTTWKDGDLVRRITSHSITCFLYHPFDRFNIGIISHGKLLLADTLKNIEMQYKDCNSLEEIYFRIGKGDAE